MAKVVGEGGLKEVAPLLVQGVAVSIMSVDDYFRSLPDLLSGSKQIHVVRAGWVFGSSVVTTEAEWASLKGDPQQHQAYMARRMQKALDSYGCITTQLERVCMLCTKKRRPGIFRKVAR
jgi:hypothetical protein